MKIEEAISKVIEEIADQRPYKEAGNADSYSQYNEGWTDACDVLETAILKWMRGGTPQVSDEEIEEAFPMEYPEEVGSAHNILQLGRRTGAKWMRDKAPKQ